MNCTCGILARTGCATQQRCWGGTASSDAPASSFLLFFGGGKSFGPLSQLRFSAFSLSAFSFSFFCASFSALSFSCGPPKPGLVEPTRVPGRVPDGQRAHAQNIPERRARLAASAAPRADGGNPGGCKGLGLGMRCKFTSDPSATRRDARLGLSRRASAAQIFQAWRATCVALQLGASRKLSAECSGSAGVERNKRIRGGMGRKTRSLLFREPTASARCQS